MQLAVNAAWSLVFFGLHQIAAALCLVPYLAWIIDATYRNAGVRPLNG